MEKEEYLVVAVKPPYDFVTDNGQRLVGFKAVVSPLGAKSSNAEYKGLVITDLSFADVGLYTKFHIVPAIYSVSFDTVFSSSGKRSRRAVAVDYVRNVELTDLLFDSLL